MATGRCYEKRGKNPFYLPRIGEDTVNGLLIWPSCQYTEPNWRQEQSCYKRSYWDYIQKTGTQTGHRVGLRRQGMKVKPSGSTGERLLEIL